MLSTLSPLVTRHRVKLVNFPEFNVLIPIIRGLNLAIQLAGILEIRPSIKWTGYVYSIVCLNREMYHSHCCALKDAFHAGDKPPLMRLCAEQSHRHCCSVIRKGELKGLLSSCAAFFPMTNCPGCCM